MIPPKGAGWWLGSWHFPTIVLGVSLAVAGVAALWAFASAHAGGNVERATGAEGTLVAVPSVRKPSIQFAPGTAAEKELENLLDGKDETLDLALANWLVAADIPAFQDLGREGYFRELDTLTQRVREDMARMRANNGLAKDGNDGATRCRLFCSALQRLRFSYTEEFRQEDLSPAQLKALYADPNHVFLAGLLRTQRGSCVSMPLIYLVIGQRLGMPVHLVTLRKHYFIRWEEPGYRMNIETTIVDRIAVTPDDAVYLEAEGLKREEVEGSQLRNLKRREVVGMLLYTRSCYWGLKGTAGQRQSCSDISRARQLAPDDPAIKRVQEAVFQRHGIKTEASANDPKPNSKN